MMRLYYKEDWHCDCEPDKHTLENYIKGLHNIFDNEYEKAHITSDEKFIHVDTNDNVVLASKIFEAEYHGLILSSIHSTPTKDLPNSQISFLFKYKRIETKTEKTE